MRVCKIDGCDSSDMATRSSMCKRHHREYTREHYKNNKDAYIKKASVRNKSVRDEHRKIVISFLSNNPCVDCGESDTEVLQFDHRERAEKVAEINRLMTCSTSKLLEEISKCDVRCANCHMKRTRIQMGWWRH